MVVEDDLQQHVFIKTSSRELLQRDSLAEDWLVTAVLPESENQFTSLKVLADIEAEVCCLLVAVAESEIDYPHAEVMTKGSVGADEILVRLPVFPFKSPHWALP